MTADLTTMTAGSLALFLVLGAGVGFVGGLFAIGGALIAIPLLTAVFVFTQHDAQGTAMVMALSSAIVTLVIYVRKKLISVSDGLLMMTCSTVMGLVGAQLVRDVPDQALQRGFGVLLVVLAIIVWFGHLGEGQGTERITPAKQIAVGTFAGALSGFFVVGGALVSVPLLERIAQYSQQRAQAMVLLMLVPASAIGLVSVRVGRLRAMGASRCVGDRRGSRRASRHAGGAHHEAASPAAALCGRPGWGRHLADRRSVRRGAKPT
jgi:uncharacterized membrane protein YfcA